MITLAPNERVELARATGRRLRVTWTIESGTADIIGAGLQVPIEDALERTRWQARRQAMLDRIDEALAAGEVDAAGAEALRSGDVSGLTDDQMDLVREWLGREPVQITTTSTSGETVVEHEGRHDRRQTVAMMVEAVAGPGGCTLALGPVEAA